MAEDFRPWLRSRRPPEWVDSVLMRCWYRSNKRSLFDEISVVELTIPVPETLTLVVEFYHAIAKVGKKGHQPIDRTSKKLFCHSLSMAHFARKHTTPLPSITPRVSRNTKI
jgi:hypothetical protein